MPHSHAIKRFFKNSNIQIKKALEQKQKTKQKSYIRIRQKTYTNTHPYTKVHARTIAWNSSETTDQLIRTNTRWQLTSTQEKNEKRKEGKADREGKGSDKNL